jgi:Spy/CpxP family protein refolding chaperone
MGLLLRPYVESTPAARSLVTPESAESESPAQLVSALATELNLTEAQRQQIEAVLNGRREMIHTFREDIRRQTEEQRRAVMADSERILSPDQRQRFEAFVARKRASQRD